jgi:hypothetical protein
MEPIEVPSASLGEFHLRSDIFACSNALDEHLLNAFTWHPEFRH